MILDRQALLQQTNGRPPVFEGDALTHQLVTWLIILAVLAVLFWVR